ncbi:MAG: protein translocase subunit SecF [Candidatus Pacebacteria bacterium]|nr:protein translocase subunit SecF [Candidatus Paceibacterota bacterium]
MYIVKHRKIFYVFSVILIAFSIFSVAKYGLNLGIDFKGGSIIEVRYPDMSSGTTNADSIKSALGALNIGEYVVRQAGDDGFIIRTKNLDEAERNKVVQTLGGELKRFDSVGPILGQELQGKAIWSMVLVLLAIIIFITYAFRGVSRPISSWKYGVVAIVALFHDVIIPTGIFSYLGRNGGYEIDALFVTALLVILGFSIHDTIVVFDRTRENLKNFAFGTSSNKKTFEEIVGMSVSQTIARSINTSLTTILALIALYIFGPKTTENFSLALILGIAVGTYSSIFIGSPLLVTWQKWQERSKNSK